MIFDTVKILHLEPTNLCNLECPLCPRETDKSFDKKHISHLTVDQVSKLFDHDVIAGLKSMYMCGNYGDPAAGQHTVEIFKYFRSINPDISLGMNTNGSLRSADYWQYLGEHVLNRPGDQVIFSIDGLEDTNHVYRINSAWDKIMTNTSAFIKTGATAVWDMLIFDYNRHQVAQAKELSHIRGFKKFNTKVSRRLTTISWLKPPADPVLIQDGAVECMAEKEKSLYVSAQGEVYPCCWLGIDLVKKQTVEHYEEIKNSWRTADCNPVCKKTCSTKNNLNSFKAQWRQDLAF